MLYLSYDLRGIQQFIFSIPKLKYMIGGSSLLAGFDDDALELFHPTKGKFPSGAGEALFAGGGKGIILLHDDDIEEKVRKVLCDKAAELGVDIRLGKGKSLADAVDSNEDLYPFVPESLEGEPCAVSGLWPVKDNGSIHDRIRKRRDAAEADIFGKGIIDDNMFRNHVELPEDSVFFKNPSPDDEFFGDDAKEDEEHKHAVQAQKALGLRNRYAVVAMDGNDIGAQHRAAQEYYKSDENGLRNWLGRMSRALAECTRKAFLKSLATVTGAWLDNDEMRDGSDSSIVLPFRPLIQGGDDVLLLCHSSYALDFVMEMMTNFSEISHALHEADEEKNRDGHGLWLATGGRLSISAGVLFCGVSYPLHTGIPYAESLLASAKGRFRNGEAGKASTAAVDWETVTDNLLDTPANRRRRELWFYDGDLPSTPIMKLTDRPYSQENFGSLLQWAEKLRVLPSTLRYEIMSTMRLPWSERIQFIARHSDRKIPLPESDKTQSLYDFLFESPDGKSSGAAWRDTSENGKLKERSTSLADAFLVIKERSHMNAQTV